MAQNKETTKDCIFTALISLMEQKEYKYITVTDIARKAGVSRMTYYRTYASKEDILVQHFQKVAQAMIPDPQQSFHAEFEQAKEPFSRSEFVPGSAADYRAMQALTSFFAYFQKSQGLTRLLEDAGLMGLLVDCFSVFTNYLYSILHPEICEDPQHTYAAHFEVGGLFSVLTHHLENGAAEEPKEMAEIMLTIMR